MFFLKYVLLISFVAIVRAELGPVGAWVWYRRAAAVQEGRHHRGP